MGNLKHLEHYFNLANTAPQDMSLNTRLIYHYASKPYDNLLTLKQQADRGILDEKQRKVMEERDASAAHRGIEAYSGHVSFFFDRPPFGMMLRNFNPNHIFWRDGATVYEHIVDAANLEPDVGWVVHSTPLDLFFYDWFWKGRPSSHPGHAKIVFQLRNMIKKLQGNTGTGVDDLLRVIARYKGITAGDFKAGFEHEVYKSSPQFQKKWYAPRVRHLNIFVKEPIEVLKVRPIRLQRNFQPNRPVMRVTQKTQS